MKKYEIRKAPKSEWLGLTWILKWHIYVTWLSENKWSKNKFESANSSSCQKIVFDFLEQIYQIFQIQPKLLNYLQFLTTNLKNSTIWGWEIQIEIEIMMAYISF